MKSVENIETSDDFGRKVELKPDYEIDISKSSYEDWLKKVRIKFKFKFRKWTKW